jgi:hypothetical protein
VRGGLSVEIVRHRRRWHCAMNIRFKTDLPVRFDFNQRPYRVDVTQVDKRFMICIRESDSTKRTQSVLNISARFGNVNELGEAARTGFDLLPHDQDSDVGRLVRHLVESGLAVVGESPAVAARG